MITVSDDMPAIEHKVVHYIQKNPVNMVINYLQSTFVSKEKRRKFSFTIGMVAEFEYNAMENTKYTGMFKGGAKNGILRFSMARKVGDNIVPSFAFKFLIDGKPSANILTMYSINGYSGDSNIMAHDFTNHSPNVNKNASFGEIEL